MDAFISRKRCRISPKDETISSRHDLTQEQSTDEKLAILASVFEDATQEQLLDALLSNDGNVEQALDMLLASTHTASPPTKKASLGTGIQSSLKFSRPGSRSTQTIPRSLTKKGKTLYLYDPASIAAHTPCTIIHNFLPPALATALLEELLPETKTYTSATFRLFENIVKSPHTASFYVNSLPEATAQKQSYFYNGSTLSDVRQILPVMRQVSALVQSAINTEITHRINTHFPNGQKLKNQPQPGTWTPNAAFVNCYDGPAQSVGWHTDQLTYLGPHPTIGSLSLGVQREFRIRRIVPPPDLDSLNIAPDSPEAKKLIDAHADTQGQISLPLPHNSLLIMHADMQEEWKHSVAPASIVNGGIVPHPVAGNKRLNITYRWYRDEFRPEFIPKCRCGYATVLKSVMKREVTRGKYVWMCQGGGRVEEAALTGKDEEKKGCGFFEWAEFDEDGVPVGYTSPSRKSGEDDKDGDQVTDS